MWPPSAATRKAPRPTWIATYAPAKTSPCSAKAVGSEPAIRIVPNMTQTVTAKIRCRPGRWSSVASALAAQTHQTAINSTTASKIPTRSRSLGQRS